MSYAIVVFVKTPGFSEIKTRLSKDLGEKQTLSFYKHCVEKTKQKCLELANSNNFSFYWAVAEKEAQSHLFWNDQKVLLQTGLDLGQRLHSISTQLKMLNHTGYFFMGADCPHFDIDLINEAKKYLDDATKSVAIGPCIDGGYYFFGSNNFFDELFWTNVRYSCENTLIDVIKNLTSYQIKYKLLSENFDIDNIDDYRSYINEFKND